MSNFTRLFITCCMLACFASAATAQVWSSGPSLPLQLKGGAAAVAEGQPCWFGGRTTGNVIVDGIHRLDPAVGLWTSLGAMPEPRDGHGVEYIGDRFIVVGGFTPDPTNTVLSFDPAGPTWTSLAPMPAPNSGFAHCTDGRYFYVFGGGHDGAPYDYAWRYDTVTDTWDVLTNLPHARKSPTAVRVGGKIVVMGGHTAGSGILDATVFVDVYDIATDSWSSGPSLPTALTGGGSAVLNGRAYVMCGADGMPAFGKLDAVFSYRPGALAWRLEPSMPAAVAGVGVVAIGDSTIYAIAGEADAGVTSSVYRFVVHEPEIVSIADVPNDQGGWVSLRWLASNLDRRPGNLVASYRVWRQVPAPAAIAALAAGAILAGDDSTAEPAGTRVLRTTAEGATVYYWELVGTQVASGFPAYSFTAPTAFDSLPSSNPWTVFMVEASNVATDLQVLSAPDSGYSKDDLSPPAPGLVSAHISAGSLTLSWRPSAAPDVATYRVYRDADPAFTPSPATLLAVVSDTSFVSTATGPLFIRVTAVDAHGNEGPATDAFANTLAVGGELSAGLSLFAPTPNPATHATRVRWTLAREGEVRLAIYDIGGRECRVLASGIQRAGEHDLVFGLDDGKGARLRAGLYFIRLQTEGRSVSTRLAIVH